MLNDLTRSIDFALSNAERGTSVAGAADAGNATICQTRILTNGIEQLRDLREEVLRPRAQMRQSYMAPLHQANRSEDSRAGTESVSPCRSRWRPAHYKKKT